MTELVFNRREEPDFAQTLGVPGLSWGASATTVTERFTREGFQVARSDPDGSILFTGHDFLGRNAGLIARMHDGRLEKIVAMMEPNQLDDLESEFRKVWKRLEPFYGPPAVTEKGP